MAFVLVRIDDRLVHGQVTVAWGTWLECDRIILVNDEVSGTPWKRELYGESDSLGTAVTVLSIADFLSEIGTDPWADERAILVVESPADLARLVEGGLSIEEANVGGMHHAPGKREVLPYVYVDDGDVAAMREIIGSGVRLTARDVPQASSVDVGKLLDIG